MNRYFISIFFMTILFLGCGQDRAATDVADGLKSSGVLGVSIDYTTDSDGDGLSDYNETNVYGTDPNSADSDGDGLSDGEEINTYETNATNADTDGDGLNDGEEIKTYETNATNSDSDGDCLLDSFEILHYETNATNADTDRDGVNDGIEIYSYVAGEYDVTCLTIPETLDDDYNHNPAKDGIPDAATDVINALDPTNDSDGDGQSNVRENNCTEGDPMDNSKICPSITETNEGTTLLAYGYAYVPGGFDVDGDGVDEGGFWMSRYQARSLGDKNSSSSNEITSIEVSNIVGNINQYISTRFKVLNRNVQVLSYDERALGDTEIPAGTKLLFKETDVAGLPRISSYMPLLAEACLSKYRLTDSNGTALDINISMPTMKQYVQVKKLLDADFAHGGDGRHIRNGLLGTDPNVPLKTFSLVIEEFGPQYKEFVENIVQLRDINGNDSFTYAKDVPDWWESNETTFKEFQNGATSGTDIGQGTGPESDMYGVVVRGGDILDVRISVTGTESDIPGQTNGISFRAATPYLY